MRSGEVLGDSSQSQALLFFAHHPFPWEILLRKIVSFLGTFTMAWSLCELILVGICPASPYLTLPLGYMTLYSGMTLTYSEFRDLLSLCKPLLHLASAFWWRKLSLPQHCCSRGAVQVAQSHG